MVVEGHSGRRLAVECDGDQYHTPDMWLADLHRQRKLERAGWSFWRCWGSSFLRDPDACMADLFKALKGLNIDPIGELEVDLSEIVEYREVGELNGGLTPDTAVQTESKVATGLFKTRVPTGQGTAIVSEERMPFPKKSNTPPRVAIGDSVRYIYVDTPNEEEFVIIVQFPSNPSLGQINQNTVVAKVLLGMEIGQEREVVLPTLNTESCAIAFWFAVFGFCARVLIAALNCRVSGVISRLQRNRQIQQMKHLRFECEFILILRRFSAQPGLKNYK
jgi:hypothetical protein